jgi:type I restriction enzyme S subunit
MVTQTLQSGYKQTEVGVIPEDWDFDEIGKLATITTGSKNTQDKIDDGQHPFFVRSQKVERINTYAFDGEAVLTAGDGVGTGKVFHYVNGKFDFHQRVYKVSDFSERLDGYFFYLYFSNAFLKRIMSMTAKSSVDSVRMEMIADMLIPLPEKGEQKAIAKAISDINDLIESLDRLIEKKKNIKRGTMQELLTGKRRLLGFSEEWQTKALGTMGSFSKGKGLPKKDISSSGTIRAIPYTAIYTDFREIINYDRIDKFTSSRNVVIVDSPHLLIAGSSNMLENVGKVTALDSNAEVAIGGDIIMYKTSADVSFLSYLLNTQTHRKRIIFLSQGSTIRHVYASTFENCEIKIPELKEQTAIAKALSDIDAEIEKLEKMRDKYKQLKIGMMQQLLTGRVRLKWKS